MKAEDVKVGAWVRIDNMASRALVLTSPFNDDDSNKWVPVQWQDTGQVCVYPLARLMPVPQSEYCAVYQSHKSERCVWSSCSWRAAKDSNTTTQDTLLGHFVRDTPDSKPRWEPAE